MITTNEVKRTLLACLERFDVSILSAAERRVFRLNCHNFRHYLDKLQGRSRKQRPSSGTAAALAALTPDDDEENDEETDDPEIC